MGNVKSVCREMCNSTKDNDTRCRASSTQSPNDGQFLTSEHDQELEILRRTVEHNPELFILNNLMLCIQFFENFEEEIGNMRQKLVSTREVHLNTCLPPHKHVLIPDVFEEKVARNVNFTYIQPSLMIPSIEPLHPTRIYVVYDNIEVTEQNFSSPYSNVNGSMTYNMQLKHSRHKGYVLLQRLEVNPSKKYIEQYDKKKSTVSTIYSESNDDGDDGNSSGCDSNLHTDNKMSHNNVNNNNNNNNNKNNSNKNNKNNISLVNERIEAIKSDINLKPEDIYNAKGRPNAKNVAAMTAFHGSKPNNGRCETTANNKDIHSSRTSPAESTSSGYRSGNYTFDSDSDDISYFSARYGATATSSITTVNSKKLKKQANDEISSEIPHQCFEIYNPRRNKKQKLNRKDKMMNNLIQYDYQYDIWYLSSHKFMDHFYELFRNKLSILMGFDLHTTRITIPSATGYSEIFDNEEFNNNYDPIIYCNKFKLIQSPTSSLSSLTTLGQQPYIQKQSMKNNKFAIIPCIWSTWPEVADEWIERPRMWPHYSIIEKIREFGCYLIPKGYADDRDSGNVNSSHNNLRNSNLKSLEWEVTFPEAERYLATCMTYSQLCVYLMSLVLHKTFIQSAAIVDSHPGLTGSHIRNQLFWLMEECDKPSRWLDNRMGEALIRLLNSLYRCISQDVPFMRDYFIRDKNIFQGKIYLLRTQKQLKRILENPIMYLIHAMQNLGYGENFFPKLDYDVLMRILTDDILALINPHIPSTINKYNYEQHPVDILNSSSEDVHSAKNYNHHGADGGFWNNAKHIKAPNRPIRKSIANKYLIDTRISYDQVIEITVRCAELQEPRRICLLLDLFIKHFIKMAEYCHKYGAVIQKSIYIDQALRLSILLSEYNAKGIATPESGRHGEQNVKIYMDRLQALKARPNRIASINKRSPNDIINSLSSQLPLPPPPPLPPPLVPPDASPKKITQSDTPIFSSSLHDRYSGKISEVNSRNNSYGGIDNNSSNNQNHVIAAVVHADASTPTKKGTSSVVLLAEDKENNCSSYEATYI